VNFLHRLHKRRARARLLSTQLASLSRPTFACDHESESGASLVERSFIGAFPETRNSKVKSSYSCMRERCIDLLWKHKMLYRYKNTPRLTEVSSQVCKCDRTPATSHSKAQETVKQFFFCKWRTCMFANTQVTNGGRRLFVTTYVNALSRSARDIGGRNKAGAQWKNN